LQIFFNSISGGKVPEGYRAGLEQVITKLILSGLVNRQQQERSSSLRTPRFEPSWTRGQETDPPHR
jgi:hypothetical protein